MLLKGFLFGLTLQLAVGPVFFAVFGRALQQGLFSALIMTLGVVLADTFYITVSFTGVSSLLSSPPAARAVSWLAGIILFAFGCSYFRPAPVADGEPAALQSAAHWWNNLGWGLKITLVNPLTIIFWSCTFGALLASARLQRIDILLYALGCILSTLAFLSLTSIMARAFVGLMTPPILKALNYLVSLFLIGFACKTILGI